MSAPGFARLGLETARIPHADRHGLLWLGRGNLTVSSGTLRFLTAGDEGMEAGEYDIPFQGLSMILLAPGTTVSHDVFRLAGRHGLGLVAVGEDGVRLYTAPPLGPDESRLARKQAIFWADPDTRQSLARRMYAWRLGEVLPHRDIAVLRGMEGARVKRSYELIANSYGIVWKGRRYNRQNPEETDDVNQALNHAATAVQAAAEIAVAATATIPQLGFIHEDSSRAFALDIADLFRESTTLHVAFQGLRNWQRRPGAELEREVRKLAGSRFRKEKLIPAMIDRIKELLDADDRGGDA